MSIAQKFRFNNSLNLKVYISTDSINWTDYSVQGNTTNNTHSPDPQFVSLNISPVAGNSSTVYVRIGWEARVYYWMIDDMQIVSFPNVYGCTDSTAFNYNPLATIDDGSCGYCNVSNTFFSNAPSSLSNCNGYILSNSTSNFPIVSYNWINSQGNYMGNTNSIINLCNDAYILTVTDSVGCSITDTIILGTILGCTDTTALNYNWVANQDDGSCIAVISGCMDTLAINFDSTANVDDGSCCLIDQIVQLGQDIDGEAAYDQSGWSVSLSSDGNTVAIGAVANDGNGSNSGHVRVYNIGSDCAGCMDPLALNYDSTVQYSDSSCIYPSGCTDTLAYNYDSNAITDDGSCLYCDLSFSIIVSQNTSPSVCDGFVFVSSVQSSNLPISYLWSNGSTQNNATNLCSGIYTLTLTDNVGCVLDTTFTIGQVIVPGCTDPLASNYNPLATIDDSSCVYATPCTKPTPNGLNATEITHNRAKVNWADANTSNCMVEMYRVQYREQGTTTWSQKTALGSGLCIYGLTTTSKTLWNLSPSTTYEYRAKAWYCNTTGASSWSPIATFTTLDVCPNVDNFTVSTPTNTRATFSWTAPSSPYSFVRIKLRVDTTGATWLTAGGYGVMYPTLTRNKNGLTPGQNYLASSRTWCDPNGGPYKATSWTPFIYWTQPGTLIRIESEDSRINNLTIYPNPSRDIFNITFQAEEKQDLKVRLLNVIGEELMVEDLQQFIGQYTKGIDLSNNAKGIYFLEIETNYGVINKKLILQ